MDQSRWPGVTRQHRITQINGRTYNDNIKIHRVLRSIAPGMVSFRVSHEGKFQDLLVESRPRGITEKTVFAIRVVVGVQLFAIGILAFYLSPGHIVSWIFLFFSASLGTLCLAASAAVPNLFALYLTTELGMALTTSFGLHLFARFPRPLSFIISSRRRVFALYAPGILLFSIFSVTFILDDWRGISTAIRPVMQIWLFALDKKGPIKEVSATEMPTEMPTVSTAQHIAPEAPQTKMDTSTPASMEK